MLSLVDYDGSDDDEINESQNEKCIYAEVVSSPNKRPTSSNKDSRTTDSFRKEEERSSILTNLPLPAPLDNKLVQQENELEDLVKRKDWELKLTKKARRKRKRHRTDDINSSSENYNLSRSHQDNRISTKKMVVIQAFSGLKGLADGEESNEKLNHSTAVSSSANLLAVLPEPKNASRIPKNSNLFLTRSKHTTGNVKKPEVLTVEKIAYGTKFEEECDDASDEDHDLIDFFGLKAVNDPPMVSRIATVLDTSRDKKFEQAEPITDMKVENNISVFVSHPEITAECCDTSTSTLSGTIDNSQALCMIYSHDIAHLGGTVSNAAKAVENIVDVSVDKVLGPNVHATLLKNLHNKSLAEATLSHLANIPKTKDTVNTVARRKHQITYLASVAVAREEQLAEQWSLNRHNKRTSARKYGF